MTSTPLRLLCPLFVLLAIGQGSEARCSYAELTSIFSCINPYNQQFFQAFDLIDNFCDRALITPDLCRSFGKIVDCILDRNVDCLPAGIPQINAQLEIPCKVEDFFAVCTDVKNPFTTDSGCAGMGATQFLWMTSLMTTLLTMILSAAY